MNIRIFGIKVSWLSFLNFFIFQWLFFRLGRKVENGKTIRWGYYFQFYL